MEFISLCLYLKTLLILTYTHLYFCLREGSVYLPFQNACLHYIYFVFIFFLFRQCRMACGILVPDQGWNPCPLQWKCGVLTTGLPGNSPPIFFNLSMLLFLSHHFILFLNSHYLSSQFLQPKNVLSNPKEKLPSLS